ncbi:MAG: response regulator [Bacteroidota bacterium]
MFSRGAPFALGAAGTGDPEKHPAAVSKGAQQSILLVDDDDAFRERMATALRRRGFAVMVAPDGMTAIGVARDRQPDFVVVDMRMPGATGLQVINEIAPACPNTKIVVLTGYGSIASAVEVLQRGAHHYLSKPIDADELSAALLGLDGHEKHAPPPLVSTPSLARADWEHIQRVLTDTNGNISETARRLGIARRTLQLKLKKDPPRS